MWPQVLEATGGAGVDVVIEMAAHANLGKDLKALKSGGRVVIVGSRGDTTLSPRDIMSREATVVGVMLFSVTPTGAALIVCVTVCVCVCVCVCVTVCVCVYAFHCVTLCVSWLRDG